MQEKKAIIMMTTYNGEKYITEQIQSIIDQTYNDWVLVVSDDGSTDHTMDILNEFKKEDVRIKEICRNNRERGAYNNFFSLMQYVKNTYGGHFDYYFYCDQDDIWSPEKVEMQIEYLERFAGQKILCFSDVEFIDGNGDSIHKRASDIKPMEVNNQLDYLFEFKYLLGTSMAHDKELWNMIQIPNDNMGFEVRHDQYIRKYAAVFGHIIYIPCVLVKYRRHESNVSAMLKNYNLLEAISKLVNSFPKILHNTALHFACAGVFLENIDDVNSIVADYRKAVERNGIEAVRFLKKYNIRISENIYERIMYEGLFFTGVYKVFKV